MRKFKEIRKLGRACFLCQYVDNETLFVLKRAPEARKSFQKMSRFLFGGSLPFQNELRILISIQTCKNNEETCVLPMLDTDGKTYYSMPFKDNVLSFENLSAEDFFFIGSSILNIPCIASPKKWNFLKEKAFNWLENPNRVFKNNLKKGEVRFGLSPTVFQELIDEVSRISRNIDRRLIHSDLGDNNILFTADKKLYFIDWEDAHMERKCIFLDVVAASFNYQDLSLNCDILNGYFKNFSEDNISIEDIIRIFSYNYLLFLYKLLFMKRMSDKSRVIELISKFVDDIDGLHNLSRGYLNSSL